MKSFYKMVDPNDMSILSVVKENLKEDEKYFYTYTQQGVSGSIFKFRDVELYFLWEKFSGTQCAGFLVATEETITQFKEWLESEENE